MVSLRDQTIAQLRDEIAALKVERDEARAEVKNLCGHMEILQQQRDEARAAKVEADAWWRDQRDSWNQALSAVEAERDEARAQVEGHRAALAVATPAARALRERCERAEAERDRLRTLLREVEWAWNPEDGEPAKVRACCPWCFAHNGDGHDDHCPCDAALEGRNE